MKKEINLALMIVFAFAILIMVNYLAARHYTRLDWTKEKLYTLSGKTKKIIKGLKHNLKIIVFISQTNPVYEDIEELLYRYKANSSKIKLTYIDPDLDPAKAQRLAKKYKISMKDFYQDGVIVFEQQGRSKFVSTQEMQEYDYTSSPYAGEPILKEFKAEEKMTEAIVAVSRKRQTTICFTQGHKERKIDNFEPWGFSEIAESLKRDNYKTQEIQLLGTNTIPKSCDLVIIAGPTHKFQESEISLIEKYYKKGGKLLVLIDPLIDEEAKFQRIGLEPFLQRVGIIIKENIAVDPQHMVPFAGMDTFFAFEYTDHEIVKDFQKAPVIFLGARALEVSDSTSSKILIKSSSTAWGETNLKGIQSEEPPEKDEDDLKGPLTLAVAVENKEKQEARIVTIGDADFVSNAQLQNQGFLNRDLFMNAVAWLSKKKTFIGISPKNPENIRLSLTEKQMSNIWRWVFIHIPLVALILGLIIWWKRRA